MVSKRCDTTKLPAKVSSTGSSFEDHREIHPFQTEFIDEGFTALCGTILLAGDHLHSTLVEMHTTLISTELQIIVLDRSLELSR